MLSIDRLLGWRYLFQRWDRSLLIIASIALGVATLVATRILNQCIETAATQTATPLASGDLLVTNGEFGVLRSVADEIIAARIPGIVRVQPLIVERVTLPELDGKTAVLIGAELSKQMLDPENPLQIQFTRTLELTLANAIRAANRRLIVVSKPIYDAWVTRRPSEMAGLLLRYGSRTVDCLPIGYMEYPDSSPVAFLGRNVIGMELSQAARTARPGPPAAAAAVVGGSAVESASEAVFPIRVNRIDIQIDPSANCAAIQAALQELIGERAQVRTPEDYGQTSHEIIGGLQIGFALCSAGAMVVGLFLVYNALSVTVAERRHDIGILRSIGATRAQIVRVFTTAAALLGGVGAAWGIPLGIVLGRGVLHEFGQDLGSMFVNPEVDPGWPTVSTLILAALAGILTAVAAALIPAVQAACEDPANAVRRIPGTVAGAWHLAHQATCTVLIAGGIAVILTRNELFPALGMHPRFGSFGGLLTALVGLLLAAPIFVGIMVRLVHPLLRRILPIEARIAADNLIRSPGRTGVVIGALGAGVAVMIQTAGVGRSNQEPVEQWLNRVIHADRFLFAGNITEANSSQTPLDPEILRQLRELPDVAAVVGFRYARPEFNGTRIMMVALDAATYAEQSTQRIPGQIAQLELLSRLGGGRVLISDNFVLKHGIRAGDSLVVPGTQGPVQLQVIGTVNDYTWARGTIFIDRSDYSRLFRDDLVDVTHVFLGGTGSPEESDAIARFAADRGLSIQGKEPMRRLLADLIDQFYTVAFLQQIVVGIVASLGVVTALLISVLQRKRELGLLLAVGATPGQIIRSVLSEALLMGLFGTVLGILIGIPLEWYVLRVVLVEESGFIFDLLVPWKQVGLIGAGSMLIAALAGLLPAWHAVRTRIPEAIAYE